MAGHGATPSDPLRKLLIVVALVGAMGLLYRFALPTGPVDPTGMLVLGFVILASFTIGQLVEVVKLPHITGYLLAGLVLGPSMAHQLPEVLQVGPFEHGILNEDVIHQLSLLDALALALIALTAGGELKLDGLRRGIASILAVLASQSILILVATTGLVTAFALLLPGTGLPELSALGVPGAVAAAAMVGVISISTSPAATIAVINGTGASGPYTRLVLSVVVLKDMVVVVLFSVVGALAHQALGTAATSDLGRFLLVHIGGSIGVGVVLGVVLTAYLRYVGSEVLLFLVGVVYTATFVSEQLHLDPVLLFIAAGVTAGNVSAAGDDLIRSVERLSLPVYVVFFTLAGARLHLDELVTMAPYVAALVLVRAGAVWAGVRAGTLLAEAPDAVRRYGWYGFISQAGVAITLASLIGTSYGDVGQELQTLIIAGVAVNELVGPVLLQLGLGFAGDIPNDERDDPTTEFVPAATPGGEMTPWVAPPRAADAWGPPAETASAQLDQLARSLESELRRISDRIEYGPFEVFRTRGGDWIRGLRREFLRHQRQALDDLHAADALTGLVSDLRVEESDLAGSWRLLTLERMSALQEPTPGPRTILDPIDDLVEGLPEQVDAPWDESSFVHPPGEGIVRRIRRIGLRITRRLLRLFGRDLPARRVRVRELVRYHLSGRLPGELEPVAALLADAEIHLADRARSLFDHLIAAYEHVPDDVSEFEPEHLEQRLWEVRTRIEAEFALATREIDNIVAEGALRASAVLGAAMHRIKTELPRYGTLDLPRRSRRYSLVFSERSRGIDVLDRGLRRARESAATACSLLALELELVRLEVRIREAVEEHAEALAGQVHTRGVARLSEVRAALDAGLPRIEQAVADAVTGEGLAARVREETAAIARVVGTASIDAGHLRDQCAREEGVSELLGALLRAAGELTERYVVPTVSIPRDTDRLRPPVPTAVVPFRELATAYIETSVTSSLVALARSLATDVARLHELLTEIERIVAFNAELAAAELDVFHGESPDDDSRQVVRGMVVGALGRMRPRLATMAEEAAPWAERARTGVRTAVLDDLEAFRSQVVGGRVAELRRRLLADSIDRARIARDMGELPGALTRAWDGVQRALRLRLGNDRMETLLRTLGVPSPVAELTVSPHHFVRPEPAVDLPIVYRRLFSDQALEAGDLLTGRQSEIAAALATLTGSDRGQHHAVAVIGMPGVGKQAVVGALARKFDRVRRFSRTAPATVHDVQAFLAAVEDDDLVVVDCLEWLFTARPGGFEPLLCLIDGVLEHAGDVRWLLAASDAVFDLAACLTPLRDAFPQTILLPPFDEEPLRAAVLARHGMSGYALRFDLPDLTGAPPWRRPQADRAHAAWFHDLHAATGGVIDTALTAWLASITHVEEDTGAVRVGPVPRPPTELIARLDDEALLTLRQVLRQGWMTAGLHAELFRQTSAVSRAHLGRLQHLGLLETRDDHVRVTHHLTTAVVTALQGRGWPP